MSKANNASKPHVSGGSGARLGTFAGVFTPSILTILGLVLFRRMGFVVGGAGVAHGLIVVVSALCIAVLTTVSLSAIATNLRVKGGGDYYLISRSLGVEFGGAIGLVLYFAQSISIAFYRHHRASGRVVDRWRDHQRPGGKSALVGRSENLDPRAQPRGRAQSLIGSE